MFCFFLVVFVVFCLVSCFCVSYFSGIVVFFLFCFWFLWFLKTNPEQGCKELLFLDTHPATREAAFQIHHGFLKISWPTFTSRKLRISAQSNSEAARPYLQIQATSDRTPTVFLTQAPPAYSHLGSNWLLCTVKTVGSVRGYLDTKRPKASKKSPKGHHVTYLGS